MAHTSHRSGPLKQANKKHKTGGHRSKGALDAVNRGRVSSTGSISKAKHGLQSKIVKRNKLKQLKKLKNETISEGKKALSSGAAPPILVAVIPLVTLENPFLENLNQVFKDDLSGDWIVSDDGHVQSPQKFRRRFHFVQPNTGDQLALLDVTKVCDSVVYIIDESVGASGEKIITSIASQGLSTNPVFLLSNESENDMKKKQINLKSVKKWIDQFAPGSSEKLFQIGTNQQAVQLLRHLGDIKKSKFSSLRSNRAHLYAEKVDYEQQGSVGTLKISGYIRGEKLNVNRLIHIPGWGDFQLEKVEKLPDPRNLQKSRGDVAMSDISVVQPSAELQVYTNLTKSFFENTSKF